MTRVGSARENGRSTRGGAEVAEAAAFWRSLGIESRAAQQRLADVTVAVKAAGGLDPEAMRYALEGAGVRTADEGDLLVIVTDDYLAPELGEQNDLSLSQGGPLWMAVRPTGTTLWVGPVFRPGSSFCWACLAERLHRNRPVERYLRDVSGCAGPVRPPRALLAASLQAAVCLAAVHVARFLASGGKSTLRDSLLTFDLAGACAAEHPVTKRPQCLACGDRELMRRRAEEPLFLRCPMDLGLGGDDRSGSASGALDAPERHQSPITGIVGGAAAPGGGTRALIEAVERYSDLYQGDELSIRARADALGERAVKPRALLGFSDAQYRDREALNARLLDQRHAIPPRFDEGMEIGWTPVWSLTYPGEHRYVPTACCYGRYPAAAEAELFPGDASGRAAGKSLEEALFGGLLALIERDAAAIWWYSRARRPCVDLKSFGDRHFDEIHGEHERHGLDLWVLDVTSDLGVPAFAAVARGEGARRLAVGIGCHLDAREGIRRALLTASRMSAQDRPLHALWAGASLMEQAYLLPDEGTPPRAAGDFAEGGAGDLRDSVLECVDRLARAGIEALALDLTRPDIGLCAARVFAPGLRHAWPRFAPGRLYDVPVRLGWLRAPLREGEFNPAPMIGY